MPKLQRSEKADYAGGLTDISGIRVGHFTDSRRPTGCTVVLVGKGAVAGVDVRGSAPGTRETDLLEPRNTIQKVHAVVLSGGSAFGLDAASGVVQYLEERGIGYPMSVPVPIVPAAILYDLGVGDPSIRPDKQAGYRACQNASGDLVEEGNVGAGAGATVGKLLGSSRAMKGGLGSASIRVGDLIVAAVVAVNAVGDIFDPESGHILAGARGTDGKLANVSELLRMSPLKSLGQRGANSTIGLIATNFAADKAAMQKIAQMSHDGLARAIRPAHLPSDGDTLFALTTATVRGHDLGQVGALAADVTARAVVQGILKARSIPGYPARSGLK